MNTNSNKRGINNSDHIVNKLIVSIRLMYKVITSIEDITLSRVRMDTLDAPQTFTLPSNDIETKSLTGKQVEVNKKIWFGNRN